MNQKYTDEENFEILEILDNEFSRNEKGIPPIILKYKMEMESYVPPDLKNFIESFRLTNFTHAGRIRTTFIRTQDKLKELNLDIPADGFDELVRTLHRCFDTPPQHKYFMSDFLTDIYAFIMNYINIFLITNDITEFCFKEKRYHINNTDDLITSLSSDNDS